MPQLGVRGKTVKKGGPVPLAFGCKGSLKGEGQSALKGWAATGGLLTNPWLTFETNKTQGGGVKLLLVVRGGKGGGAAPGKLGGVPGAGSFVKRNPIRRRIFTTRSRNERRGSSRWGLRQGSKIKTGRKVCKKTSCIMY